FSLYFAPATCIMAGIALSGAFDVFTSSVKSQLPCLPGDSDVSLFLVSLHVHILTRSRMY
ncbi:hypothetical protein MKX01_001117, partial [Papaver californicum]